MRSLYAAALILVAGPVLAADAQAGRAIAERWCASCHVVSPQQTSGGDEVPTFAEIAARDDLDVERLATFLSSPHPVMPDMALTRREIEHLVAHIESLRE